MPSRILRFACQAWFASWVAALVIPIRVLGSFIHSLPIRKANAERLYSSICGYAFKLCILVCPWIQISWKPTIGAKKGRHVMDIINEKKGPVICFMNHTSFIDSLIASVVMAGSGKEFRFLMTAGLFGIPLWGEMCRLLGHFPVHSYTNKKGSIGDPLGNSNHDDFSIDKKKQADETKRMEEYVARGGNLLVFPEGTINRQIRKRQPLTSLQPFRFGSFSFGMKHKMHSIGIAACGCHIVWPWKAIIGGLPGKISLVAIDLGNLGNASDKKEASVKAHDTLERESVALFSEIKEVETGPSFSSVFGIILLITWVVILLPLITLSLAITLIISVFLGVTSALRLCLKLSTS
mmetsp:Transcript_15245/g.23083  ORF Transcript_15245/g.23083 Transcript_15245/m.23083 type:complete len:350 (+) Transcript_15245:169-1218(+)